MAEVFPAAGGTHYTGWVSERVGDRALLHLDPQPPELHVRFARLGCAALGDYDGTVITVNINDGQTARQAAVEVIIALDEAGNTNPGERLDAIARATLGTE